MNSLSALTAGDHMCADRSFIAALGTLPLLPRHIPTSSTIAVLRLKATVKRIPSLRQNVSRSVRKSLPVLACVSGP
jgi:hypothetical protein